MRVPCPHPSRYPPAVHPLRGPHPVQSDHVDVSRESRPSDSSRIPVKPLFDTAGNSTMDEFAQRYATSAFAADDLRDGLEWRELGQGRAGQGREKWAGSMCMW